jgi:hypothetical protein
VSAINIIDNQNAETKRLIALSKQAGEEFGDVGTNAKNAARGLNNYKDTLLDMTDAQKDMNDEVKNFALGLKAIDDQKLKDTAQAWDDISETMGGTVGKIRADFEETQGKLLQEQATLMEKIGELSKKQYLTPAQKEELKELTEKLGLVGEELSKNFKTKEKEMKLYFLENGRKQLEDMGPEGQTAFETLAVQMGLIDEPTKKLIEGVRGIIQEWKNSKDQVGAYDKFLQSMSKYYEIEIKTIFTTEGVDRTAGFSATATANAASAAANDDEMGMGGASGMDFVVPPGFANDSYPLWVQSGEHVSVTPSTSGLGGNQAISLLKKIAAKPAGIDERRLALLLRDAMLQARNN